MAGVNTRWQSHNGCAMQTEFAPRRHDFVWLAPDTVAQDENVLAARWIERGLPAVVARRDPVLRSDHLNLGISLPAAEGRSRIALKAPLASIERIAPPPRLVAESAPVAWRAALRELVARAFDIGVEFHVYGSLAWQHLTGLRYVLDASDVDLLWAPSSLRQLESGLMLLSSWESVWRLKADGEIILPDGASVAWRELLAAKRRVLVKHLAGVSLRDRDAALASLITT